MSASLVIRMGGIREQPSATRLGRSLSVSAEGGLPAERMERIGDLSVVLEGRLYSPGRNELNQMLDKALAAESCAECLQVIRGFTAEADGEFVVAAEHAGTGRAVVFNDALGRLPLFQARHEEGLVLARSVSAAASAAALRQPDRMGLAMRLLFGYPLDARTEVEGVSRFAESGIVWREGAEGAVQVSFGRVDYGGGAEGETRISTRAVESLGECLITAVRDRVKAGDREVPTLALSGGFDSRLVACALARTGAPWEAVTRRDHLVIGRDADVAGNVAAVLGIPHHGFETGGISPELARDLAVMSDGTLGLGLAHMLGFLRNARAALSAPRFLLTGDGGDKTVAPLLPPGRLGTAGEVNRLLSAVPPAEFAACRELTGVTPRELRSHVAEAFESQPGETAAEKLRALLFRQRAGRWLSRGEDRNRSVFWSTSPFYAPRFLAESNRIADSAKQRDALYLRLLKWFDPKLAAIPRPGMGQHRFRDRFLLEAHLQMSRSVRLSGVYRRLKRHPRGAPLDSAYQGVLEPAARDARGIWALAGPDTVRRLLDHPPSARFRDQLAALALAGSVCRTGGDAE